MSALEMLILLGFGVPIVGLSFAFVICAGLLQDKENRAAHQGQ